MSSKILVSVYALGAFLGGLPSVAVAGGIYDQPPAPAPAPEPVSTAYPPAPAPEPVQTVYPAAKPTYETPAPAPVEQYDHHHKHGHHDDYHHKQQYPGKYVNRCSYGSGARAYKQGYKQASMTFNSSWRYLGKDCDKLDRLYSTLKRQCPSHNDCKQKGYMSALRQKYAYAQDNCVSECAGVGQETGKRLGVQFCAVTSAAPSLMSGGITAAVCNAVESTECYTAYEQYVDGHCHDAKWSNKDYYDQMSSVCAVTQ